MALLLLVAAWLVGTIAADTDQYQWDFQMYYHAARADAAGLNPYDPGTVWRLSGGRYQMRFVYPPLTLPFFRLWTNLPYETAFQLWLVFKLLLLGGLITIWKRYLFPREPTAPFLLILLLAFSATVYIDLIAGNISIIEQFLLWSAFLALLRKKPLLFCGGVLVASLFKLTPIIFVFCLPFLPVRNRWVYVGGSLAAFAAFLGLGYALDPVAYREFFAAAAAIDEGGSLGNPSLYSLVHEIAGGAGSLWKSFPVSVTSVVVYVLAAAAVVAATWRRIRRMPDRDSAEAATAIIFLACLTYALIMPRFKTYSFILLLPPAYYILRRSAQIPAYGFLLALLLLTVHPPLPVALPFRPVLTMLWAYYPLLLAILLWVLLLKQGEASEDALRPTTP
ncbi:MAG TPA: glycosyltransferase family 87 protein [Acidobacteriota bacterium]|nr:glycosyltransferase family 87 protein [Acidobacteriota bacterium]